MQRVSGTPGGHRITARGPNKEYNKSERGAVEGEGAAYTADGVCSEGTGDAAIEAKEDVAARAVAGGGRACCSERPGGGGSAGDRTVGGGGGSDRYWIGPVGSETPACDPYGAATPGPPNISCDPCDC